MTLTTGSCTTHPRLDVAGPDAGGNRYDQGFVVLHKRRERFADVAQYLRFDREHDAFGFANRVFVVLMDNCAWQIRRQTLAMFCKRL